MAKLTSHTLNGADGSHASAIPVTLEHVISKKSIFSSRMDSGGRLSVDIDPKTYNLSVEHLEEKLIEATANATLISPEKLSDGLKTTLKKPRFIVFPLIRRLLKSRL